MTTTMKMTSLICAAAILSGCAAANDAADAVARDRAKTVVNGVVEERFPGLDARPVTDCIIDAASAGEIIEIAGASVTGVTQSTVEQVVDMAQARGCNQRAEVPDLPLDPG